MDYQTFGAGLKALPGLLYRAVFFLREYFFPFGCSLCKTELVTGKECWYGLCASCRAQLEKELAQAAGGARCDCCGKPLVSEHGRCLSCRSRLPDPEDGARQGAAEGKEPPVKSEPPGFDRALVLFPYTGKYRQLLEAYKFKKNLALGNFLAEKITEALQCGVVPPDAKIVPVPPRPGKIRKTGWDQVEYLAKLLERNKGGPALKRCLKRLRSKTQKELGRESRRINLQGRITLTRRPPQTAVVLDDVMTTGSTLDVCASVLKAGGAQTVYGLCLFYD